MLAQLEELFELLLRGRSENWGGGHNEGRSPWSVVKTVGMARLGTIWPFLAPGLGARREKEEGNAERLTR